MGEEIGVFCFVFVSVSVVVVVVVVVVVNRSALDSVRRTVGISKNGIFRTPYPPPPQPPAPHFALPFI